MKKILRFLFSIILLFSIMNTGVFAINTATPTSASVLVNGETVSFEAYNIEGNNYFKLRDLAKALSNTEKQFEVSWDSRENTISLSSNKIYTSIGGELASSGIKETKSAVLSSALVYLDGSNVNLTAYNIDGYNYFKLRDVGSTMDFGVSWDGTKSTITINTSIGYSDQSNLTVHFLDVGQGDSTFIVFPDRKTILIDAGEGQYGDTIVNYIKSHGYSKIDYLIATHPHADHIGGITKVLEILPIGSIYIPNTTTTTQTFTDLLTAIKNKGLKINIAKAGVSIVNSDGISVSIIAPNSSSYEDLNNYSAVIKLKFNNNSFLFMGDAEELSEAEITANVKADVIKIGHHGSQSSTGDEFLNRVLPRYAIISVGADNSYGHPSQITIDKLNKAGVNTYRTDQDGTVVFESDGTSISVNKTPSSPTGISFRADDSKPNIVITKVDKVEEIVTIKNSGTNDVILIGWVLVSVTGNQRFTFPSYTIKAGDHVTIASGSASGDLLWTKTNIWNNSSSDPAQLYDSAGSLIFTYSD